MPNCGVEAKSICQILWCCPSSRDVWGECSRKIQKCSIGRDDFFRVASGLLEKLEHEKFEFLATLARGIWLRRNGVVFGGKFLRPQLVVQNAMEVV